MPGGQVKRSSMARTSWRRLHDRRKTFDLCRYIAPTAHLWASYAVGYGKPPRGIVERGAGHIPAIELRGPPFGPEEMSNSPGIRKSCDGRDAAISIRSRHSPSIRRPESSRPPLLTPAHVSNLF
ncbi:hypothetical protein VTH06DRAFT_602 [Thermothelomyces fergusii]